MAVWVHGIHVSADDIASDGEQPFETLLEGLVQSFPGRAVLFRYYQDLAFDVPETGCVDVQPVPAIDPASDMPAPSRPGSNHCDSMSDLAYNAVLLHALVEELYEETGRPVILIGNSLGGAIIRGMLSYSADLEDDVASTMVDSVFFLQAAHDGSHTARQALTVGEGVCLFADGYEATCRESYLEEIASFAPAAVDVAAMSDWYVWANPGSTRLPNLPYYNVYGDIIPQFCALAFLPATCLDIGSWGDGLLAAGTDDPFDVADGGARFLNGGLGMYDWQYTVGGRVHADTSLITFVPGNITEHPAYHSNFGVNLATLQVASCFDSDGSTIVSLLDELRVLIDGRNEP